jgi:prepilin-type N-terminal cleavage/methylation domain-containing protein
MHRNTSQRGFSIVETLLVVAVLVALGLVGYKVYNRQHNDSSSDQAATAQNSGSATASNVASAPAINSTSDLDKASATLDQTNPDSSNSSDAGQLTSQANSF